MRIVVKWKIEKNTSISACAVDPVHDKILIGVESEILMVDVNTGSELASYKKHSGDITCLGFRKDGLFFASGGKDNVVYLWDINIVTRPINKITFQDSLLQINYNPCILNVSS